MEVKLEKSGKEAKGLSKMERYPAIEVKAGIGEISANKGLPLYCSCPPIVVTSLGNFALVINGLSFTIMNPTLLVKTAERSKSVSLALSEIDRFPLKFERLWKAGIWVISEFSIMYKSPEIVVRFGKSGKSVILVS